MSSLTSKFVPYCAPMANIPAEKLEKFLNILSNVDKLLVLTGAGISTESGIPDYRSKGVGQYSSLAKNRPITIQQFMSDKEWRQRYWARNFVAFPMFNTAKCNATHFHLAKWERSKKLLWLITQNVDGLHTKAGSTRLTELHGTARRVLCMKCQRKYPRNIVQEWIEELNVNWRVSEIGELAPDGDININDSSIKQFQVPHCPSCGPGSILKTEIVFFGDNIDKVVDKVCKEKLSDCTGLLIMGSSLTVLSGYRFVYGAHMKEVPVLIVNIGPTRADLLASVKLDAKCSEIVKFLSNQQIFCD